MRRRGLKPVVLVELSGPLVECLYEQGPHPGVLRYGHGAIDGVLRQGRPQMESLPYVGRAAQEFESFRGWED